MNAEYQKLADKLSKLALEANAVAIQMEQLEQAESGGKPKDGQEYWYFDSGLVGWSSKWNNYNHDNERWNAGNVHLTMQEAENARDFKLAVVRINREIDRLNKLERWVVNYNDSQFKWHPTYDYYDNNWYCSSWQWKKTQFTFKDSCKSAIESVLKSHAADFDIVQKCGAM